MTSERTRMPAPQADRRRGPFLATIALVLATLALYSPALHFDFVHVDDDVYVTANRAVRAGLTLESLRWAFATGHAGFWHPLTWISHMLDIQLYGLWPGGHHLTSVLLHGVNALVLFGALSSLTGAGWRSALVAALFALHPLHVESVAWVAERKDALSALFFFLTLWAYGAWVRRRGALRFMLSVTTFALALMAKPTAVTLPFVLLLLDHWPLGRWRTSRSAALVAEKTPFLLLAGAASALTFALHRRAGALVPLEEFPLDARLANALVSYARYLGKTFWPTGLAAIYPLPLTWPPWAVAGAAALLVLATCCVAVVRTRPYLLVGWLWFLGTLLPVIGLVQAGPQAMADRFTYVPLVGLFIMVAWGGHAVLARAPGRTGVSVSAGAAALVLGVLAWASHQQIEHWRNSRTLLTHTLAVTDGNWFAHNNLGAALAAGGQTDEAIGHFEAALRLRPDDPEVHRNLGVALVRQQRIAEGIAHFEQALRQRPAYADAHNNLGEALYKSGRVAEALAHLRTAEGLAPADARVRTNLGVALAVQGDIDDAIRQLREAVRLDPDLAEAHHNLALALALQGHTAEAEAHRIRAGQLGVPGR